MTSHHDRTPRRRFLAATATAASAAAFAGCMDDSNGDSNTTGEGAEGDASADSGEAGDGSDLGTEVELSQTADTVTVEVVSTGSATRLTVERLDDRHDGPDDAEETPGDEVGSLDLVAGENRLTLRGRAEGRYVVVASTSQGERDVVTSFRIPSE